MKKENYIVAIGLSAGGLEPLKNIIENIKPNLNASYIIAEHNPESKKNRLKDILSQITNIPIHYAKDDEKIKPKTIYICPSNHHITISNNKFELYSLDEKTTFKPSINWLFESLSKYQNKAIAIILSGSLNDGSNGILNVKLNGGTVIIQDPKTAQFPMMPQSAINTNFYDFILTPEQIALTLNKFLKLGIGIKTNKIKIVKNIFKILKKDFKIDFEKYKINTILRRIERRIILHKFTSFKNYLNFLKNNPKEKKALFNDLLIVVTSFCRNQESFHKLKQTLEHYIIRSKNELKIWNIGCATGEESYSLAMIIQDILEKNNLKKDFKIISTDVSKKAIKIAKQGIYTKNEINYASPICDIKYFQKSDNYYQIIPKIRKHISFKIHNILKDKPLENIDLIVCRNLLIYFKLQAQENFFSMANIALKDSGLLFIGKTESIPEKSKILFNTIDYKTKIYQKTNKQLTLFPISYHKKSRKRLFEKIENELNETQHKLNYTLEELSTSNEELSTSNEELQSSNEELVSTNEKLRIANETLKEYQLHLEKKVKEKTKKILQEQQIREEIEKNYIFNLKKELKKKMKELRKKDILLQNEYKLARMGELLANISHQYRQPLNRLSLNLSNLEADIDNISKEDILKYIEKSYDTISFLSETIDDFKNLFNTNTHKDIINLYDLIKNIFNFIEIHKIIHKIEIQIEIDTFLKIATSPNELTHILINLIHNAKDAIIETKPENPFIKISTKLKDDDIIIEVKDNGGGVKNLNKLFLPYVTTKKYGVGIGLYMSKVIAQEKLNAKLWAKNYKDGAIFCLRIKNETNL